MSVQIKNVHPVSIPVTWSKLAFPVQRSFLIFIGILLTIGNNHTAIRIPDQTNGAMQDHWWLRHCCFGKC